MPRGTIILTPGSIILPLVAEEPIYQVYVIDGAGGVHDILNDVISIDISQTSREAVWACTVNATNKDGAHTNEFTNGETIVIKADYSSGDIIQFIGRIDNERLSLSESSGWLITWTARNYPELVDQTISIQFFGATPTNCMKGDTGTLDSLGNYEDGVLYNTNIAWDPDNIGGVAAIQVFASYQKRKKWEVIRDICEKFDYDCYVWYNETASGSHAADTWYFKMFLVGTITNSNESIVYGRNLLGVAGVGVDKDQLFNRVLVSGSDDDDVLLLRRADNVTAQNALWVKELHVDNTSIKTHAEIKTQAEALLEFHSQEQLSGAISSLGLETLRPGEKVPVYVPNMNLDDDFIVREIRHDMDSEGWVSTVQLEKRQIPLSEQFLINRIVQLGLRPYKNFNSMTDSLNLDFNDTEDTLNFIESKSNVTVYDSEAYQTSTALDGIIISETLIIENDASAIELRVSGSEDIDDSEYYVSTNNGQSWMEIPYPLTEPFAVSAGKLIKLKVLLISTGPNPNPKFDNVALLIRT